MTRITKAGQQVLVLWEDGKVIVNLSCFFRDHSLHNMTHTVVVQIGSNTYDINVKKQMDEKEAK